MDDWIVNGAKIGGIAGVMFAVTGFFYKLFALLGGRVKDLEESETTQNAELRKERDAYKEKCEADREKHKTELDQLRQELEEVKDQRNEILREHDRVLDGFYFAEEHPEQISAILDRVHREKHTKEEKADTGRERSKSMPGLPVPLTLEEITSDVAQREENLVTNLASLNVLLVEDNSADRKHLLRSLRRHHIAHKVVVAETGMGALTLMRSGALERPYITLLDLELPDMSGLDVLEQVREDKKLVDLTIWVLSGSGEEETRTRALELGATGYLIKGEVTEDASATLVNTLRREWARLLKKESAP